MSLFSSIDKFIGRGVYKILVTNEAKALLKVGISEPEAIAKIIYGQRSKVWKSYDIGIKEITSVVEKACEIRPLKGIRLKLALHRARITLRDAVKQKRIVFLGENKAKYTDRGYSRYVVTFDELAGIFIEKTKQGFQRDHIIGILETEFKKRRKVKDAT